MEIIIIYVFYAWVIIIHACFIGISAYAIWGKKMIAMSAVKAMTILFVPLAFLEFYWIPTAKYLGLSLFTNNAKIHAFYGSDETVNILNSFSLMWYHPIVFLLGAYLAFKVGKWSYFR